MTSKLEYEKVYYIKPRHSDFGVPPLLVRLRRPDKSIWQAVNYLDHKGARFPLNHFYERFY